MWVCGREREWERPYNGEDGVAGAGEQSLHIPIKLQVAQCAKRL